MRIVQMTYNLNEEYRLPPKSEKYFIAIRINSAQKSTNLPYPYLSHPFL